jgi:hypothetical protein
LASPETRKRGKDATDFPALLLCRISPLFSELKNSILQTEEKNGTYKYVSSGFNEICSEIALIWSHDIGATSYREEKHH